MSLSSQPPVQPPSCWLGLQSVPTRCETAWPHFWPMPTRHRPCARPLSTRSWRSTIRVSQRLLKPPPATPIWKAHLCWNRLSIGLPHGRRISRSTQIRSKGTCQVSLRWLLIILSALSLLPFGAPCARGEVISSEPAEAASPDGQCRIELLVGKVEQAPGAPMLRVTFKGRPVLLHSPVQIELADGVRLGTDTIVESSTSTTIQTEFRQHPGKRSRVVDRCRETVIQLRERAMPSRRWEIILRAYDDGVAFRYRLPAQEGWPSLVLSDERVVLNLADDAVATALPLNGFTTSYEKRYEKKLVGQLPGDWLLGLPLLLELPGTGWAAITEANLTDHAGLYLAPAKNNKAALVSRLSPLPGEPKVAVRAALPHESPWRVILIAEQPGRLIESDMLLNLNAPCAIDDISWIKPGKTTFPWWNGFYEEKLPFQPGLNTATAKYYIDFWPRQASLITRSMARVRPPGTAGRSCRTRGLTSPGVSRVLTCPRSWITPGRRGSGSGSGCTGKRPRLTCSALFRCTGNGALKGS